MSLSPGPNLFGEKIVAVASAFLLSTHAFAWGPHSEIAQAALDVIGADDRLIQQLGPDAKRLAQYVWMADWRQQLHVRSDEAFYSDDYLLFPAATRHYQHICPELESALETARIAADLLHTLGVLSAKDTGDATLTGKVIAPKIEHTSLSRLPAKVVLLGTAFSTLSEPDGSFCLRHLPAGEYRLLVSASGRVSQAKIVKPTAASSVALDPVNLSKGADGNLIRNGNFALRRASGEGFDDWSLRAPPGKLAAKTPMRDWEGEWIPLQSGITCQLAARWKVPAADASGLQVFLRTKAKPDYNFPADGLSAGKSGTRFLWNEGK